MKISVIGGGTGTSVVLQGLKYYEDLDIRAIVSMMDDGGSNAIVRDQLGLLPLSDLRKAIIALSKHDKDEEFRKIFTYRFSKGEGLKGHTLGNLIMAGLSEIVGSEIDAISAVSSIFDIQGEIIPVTLDDVRLIADYDDGSRLTGEHFIDESGNAGRIVKLSLNSKAMAYEGAVRSILESDFIVIGPGDLFTSILANIVVPGISEALKETSAKLVYITNLTTKKGETAGMKATDMVKTVEDYVGRKMDYILINSKKPADELVKIYQSEGGGLLEDDLARSKDRHSIVREDLLLEEKIVVDKGDTLKRSLIRHDPEKLAEILYSIFRKGTFDIFRRIIGDVSWP